MDANILQSSTYLLLPLIPIENAENRQFPFFSDLKQNKIILNNNRQPNWAMVTLVTNFSNYKIFLQVLRFCKSVRCHQFIFYNSHPEAENPFSSYSHTKEQYNVENLAQQGDSIYLVMYFI